jgi:hypothetical protein
VSDGVCGAPGAPLQGHNKMLELKQAAVTEQHVTILCNKSYLKPIYNCGLLLLLVVCRRMGCRATTAC